MSVAAPDLRVGDRTGRGAFGFPSLLCLVGWLEAPSAGQESASACLFDGAERDPCHDLVESAHRVFIVRVVEDSGVRVTNVAVILCRIRTLLLLLSCCQSRILLVTGSERCFGPGGSAGKLFNRPTVTCSGGYKTA